MFMFWPLKFAIKIVSLLITAIVVYLVVSGFQVVLASRLPAGTKGLTSASTIVVLGSTTDQNGPSADLLGRLEEGLACYHAHLAPTLTVTGVATPGEANVAAAEAVWYEENRVPKSAIHEVTGSNTAAQLRAVTRKLGKGTKVIIVTDALKALWTHRTATDDGLVPEISPATNSEKPAYTEIGTIWNQASAVAVGRIIGFGRASWA